MRALLPVPQLREILSNNAMRVIDLFREWDDDNSGSVSKKEFRKAMTMLGFEVPKSEVDALFDVWDPDGSGQLTMDELQTQLRRGADVELDAKLRAGAMGRIETEKTNKVALRKDKVDRADSTMLQGVNIDEASEKSVAEQVLP